MKNYIEINGMQVLDATPDYNRPLALVDVAVLRRLTDLLPKTDFSNIRHNLREQIMNTNNLEQLVDVCADFIAFQKSVNLITELTSSDVSQVCNIDTEPETGVNPKVDWDVL